MSFTPLLINRGIPGASSTPSGRCIRTGAAIKPYAEGKTGKRRVDILARMFGNLVNATEETKADSSATTS